MWQAYRALQAINDAAPVDMLIADGYDGIPEGAFNTAPRRAYAWITTFHRS